VNFAAGSGLSLDRVPWTIKNLPTPVPVQGLDGSAFVFRLESGNTVRSTLFTISGTALAMADEGLPQAVAEARVTDGRSVIEHTLAWPEPPERIESCSMGMTFFGGQPPATRTL